MRIFECDFDPITYPQTLDWARETIRSRGRGYITTVNVSVLMAMRSNRRLSRFVESSDITVADGQPIVWFSRFRGTPLPERVTATALVSGLCETAAGEGASVYFLGGDSDAVNNVAEKMKKRYAALDIAGIHDGFFDRESTPALVQDICQSGAKILFVGMEVPYQEEFLEDHWDELGVQIAIPVGDAFDMISGKKPRASKWIQSIGCEWLWRLYLEPRRLAKRYAISNTQFLSLAFGEVMTPNFKNPTSPEK